MLESLYVKNLALIDELEVSFREGLNILTGETGAGKSIILGSINLALGQRAQKEMIRDGAEYALVELLFTLESERQTETVRSMDLPVEEDRILIQRKIQANRSSCRVNGETVSQKQLQELADCLLDIHGQQDRPSCSPGKERCYYDQYDYHCIFFYKIHRFQFTHAFCSFPAVPRI